AGVGAEGVAAGRVEGVEGGVRGIEASAIGGPAEALADEIAVDHGSSGSSPRAALWRYGGKRHALSRERRPPCPRAANSAVRISSPVSRRGSTRSKAVACENMPQAGKPRTRRPGQRARPT